MFGGRKTDTIKKVLVSSKTKAELENRNKFLEVVDIPSYYSE